MAKVDKSKEINVVANKLSGALEALQDISNNNCMVPLCIWGEAGIGKTHSIMSWAKNNDYIENPKDSGYRSLHLVVEVPICFQNHTRWIKIEVQLRTTAMDYWAGLDYQFRYKKSKKEADIIGEELRDCAVVIEKMDKKYQ